MIALKLGLRNLARNRWRSGLTLAAVAVAVGLMVWTLAFYGGWLDQMVQGATAVEVGQIQVHTAAYAATPRSYRSFPESDEIQDAIRQVPGVVSTSPRVEVHGLLGNEQRSQVVRILGVDPEREAETTPVTEAIVSGRWLSERPPPAGAPLEVVLGSGVAQQLRVAPGDELVIFLEASDGSLGNDLLEVVGVVRTANTQVDRMTVYLRLPDAQFLAALEGQVHEIAIHTDDLDRARLDAEAVAQAIGAEVGPTPDSPPADENLLLVRPWQEIMPAIGQMLVLFKRSYWVMYLLIYVVAAVGVLNTQRMSALERRREFGVMMAIGMRPRRMFRTLQVETVVLSVVGAVLGAIAGGALAWYHATVGFDLTLFTDQASFSYMGVAFSDRLFFTMSAVTVLQPVAVMMVVALISGLWPAVRAARIDPAPTISGRT